METHNMSRWRTVTNITIAIQIIGIIVLFFCPILILKQISYPSSDATEILVSPFLTVYSISTIFLILIPLLVCFVLDSVSIFQKNRVLDFIELLISLYVLVICICLFYTLRFSLLGMALTLLFAIVMFLASATRIYLDKREKKQEWILLAPHCSFWN